MEDLKKYYHINEDMEKSMCNLSEGIQEESIELGKEEGKLEAGVKTSALFME